MNTLKSVFQTLMSDLKVDKSLLKAIHDFERGFVNYDEEHIAFFGGHTMGVHKMRFRVSDRENWFANVLQTDEMVLEEAVLALPSINSEWARASDTMNLACAWLIHYLKSDRSMPVKDREEACVQVALVMMYKFLGSLMAHYYPYTADEEVMNAMYASLSKKYALKQAGSWGVLLRQRAEELVGPTSVHRRVFEKFDSDDSVVKLVNDVQGRLRQIVKAMTEEFYRMRSTGGRISAESDVLDINGEAVLLDRSKRYSTYIRYMHGVISDRNSFIRKELVNVVTDMMHTMPPRVFEEVLVWMSKHHGTAPGKEVEILVDETLLYAFDLLSTNRSTLGGGKGLSPLLTRLRALYMASRMSDPVLLRCKELSETIVNKATRSKSSSVVASVRTGIQLYIVLRAMSMKHYQS